MPKIFRVVVSDGGGCGKKRGRSSKTKETPAEALARLYDEALGRPLPADEWEALPEADRYKRLRRFEPNAAADADAAVGKKRKRDDADEADVADVTKFDAEVEETLLGRVYWLKPTAAALAAHGGSAAEWAKAQPWFESLLVQPKKNSLAPSARAPYSVWYKHHSKPDWVGIPRFLGLSLFGPPTKDTRTLGEPMTAALAPTSKLREEQVGPVDACVNMMQEGGGATAIAECGFGKTFLSLTIAARLGRKTLILVNRSMLIRQWRASVAGTGWTWTDTFVEVDEAKHGSGPIADRRRTVCPSCEAYTYGTRPAAEDDEDSDCAEEAAVACVKCGFSFLPDWEGTAAPTGGWFAPGVRVGTMQGPYKPNKKRRVEGKALAHQSDTVPSDVEDKDIVIGSIDSVAQCAYPRELLDQFGTVVIDEGHHLAASTLSQVLAQLLAHNVLMLTATPDRPDGLEHVLYWLSGPTAFVWRRIPQVTGVWGSVHAVQLRYGGGRQEEVVYRNGTMGFGKMQSLLADDSGRNAFLLRLAVACLTQWGRKKVVVICQQVDHAAALRKAITDATGIRVAQGYGSLSVAQQGLAKAASTRAVVGSYQLLGEAYDDPALDTLIMATPRSNVQQVVGRIERRMTGKLLPLVLDVVDMFSVFEAMGYKRLALYRERGFRLNLVDVPSNEFDVSTLNI